MPEFRDLLVSALELDSKNPRLPAVEEGQTDSLHRLWSLQPAKMLGLANDIVEHGMDPGTRMLVVHNDDSDGYRVLEGNRRLAALRALRNEDSVAEQLSTSQIAKLRALSARFRKRPVTKVACVVFESADAADHWVALRHTPPPDGSGVVLWGAAEKARHAKRRGVPEAAVQVVDLVRDSRHLDPQLKKALDGGRFLTNLRRLLNDRTARNRMGVEVNTDGRIAVRTESLKGLARIVSDFAGKKKKVADIYTELDRQAYLDSLGGVLATNSDPDSFEAPRPAPRARTKAPRTHRTKLAPIQVTIQQDRIAGIYKELVAFELAKRPNAIGVLLRVFLELSVDHYLEDRKIMTVRQSEDSSLRHKMDQVLKHLQSTQTLSKGELQPIRRAIGNTRRKLDLDVVETLHAYVHNHRMVPRPDELRSAWEDLIPLFRVVWS